MGVSRDDGRGRAQRWGVFGEFRDVFKSAKVKTCAEAMALKSKLKKMIEGVRANDDEEEYERMKERVEKAPILSLLFEKEGGEEDDDDDDEQQQQQDTLTPPPPPPNNRTRVK